MSALNNSQLVQQIRAELERLNNGNGVVGMNDARVVEELEARLAAPTRDGKTLREIVARVLADFPQRRPLP
jgi:hypothetical protein